MVDEMVHKLYARARDVNDPLVNASWIWDSFAAIPGDNKANMDEIGSNTNKGRKKVAAHVDSMRQDSGKHVYSETDGDNNPFHTTVCLTSWGNGRLYTPPMLGHSNPNVKDGMRPKLTQKLLDGIVSSDAETGRRVNPSGIRVFVTKSGSMTRDRFPTFCQHFVDNLPEGKGKGGEPVVLVFDGHASRWSFAGLKLLLDNNVYCLCLPGHTSIWAQPMDCGPNASWKSALADVVEAWRGTSCRTSP